MGSKQMTGQITHPPLHVRDTIVLSFWAAEYGVITRTGIITDLYDVSHRPYCIYLDSATNKPCGFYLDSEVAITVLQGSE